jgi:hypothetical protein
MQFDSNRMAAPRHRRSPTNLTRPVQTHITEKAGELLASKCESAGVKESAYVRILILRHLGLLPSSDDAPDERKD